MKRHVAAVLVFLTTAVVIDSHVDWERLDGRRLFNLNGQRFDVQGWAAEQALQWRRDCSAFAPLPLDSPTAQAVLTAIQQHSLPDSQSARGLQMRRQGNWSVAEVTFETLKPALVVLQLNTGQWRVQDQAVWSGSTAPWNSAHFVRSYLRQQAPDLPQALLQCIDIDPQRYGPGPGGLGPVPPSGKSQP
ncbi:hypothetical protein [Limnohabitans sp.]|jgi:hypothetical protein|uniref:hypothetical protein n=1 Tax=Limnohabitans sp. TaxID=1907725 RepID=UPI0039BC6514|nr:hypothetical protein [Comamonadaceae bacterium]